VLCSGCGDTSLFFSNENQPFLLNYYKFDFFLNVDISELKIEWVNTELYQCVYYTKH